MCVLLCHGGIVCYVVLDCLVSFSFMPILSFKIKIIFIRNKTIKKLNLSQIKLKTSPRGKEFNEYIDK